MTEGFKLNDKVKYKFRGEAREAVIVDIVPATEALLNPGQIEYIIEVHLRGVKFVWLRCTEEYITKI